MRLYLLSVEEFNNGSNGDRLRDYAKTKLDACRLEKLQHLRPGKASDLALGAGLLLQLALQEAKRISNQESEQAQEKTSEQALEQTSEVMRVQPEVFTVSKLLVKLGDAEQISYRYGTHGKPDFAEGSWHFNLSHSEQYVCCALSKEEVGVDIQRMRPLKSMCLAERFFSARERQSILECPSSEEQTHRFYELWVKKEAYAKLTGDGIAETVEKDTDQLTAVVEWQEYCEPEGYRMAVCRKLHNNKAIQEWK